MDIVWWIKCGHISINNHFLIKFGWAKDIFGWCVLVKSTNYYLDINSQKTLCLFVGTNDWVLFCGFFHILKHRLVNSHNTYWKKIIQIKNKNLKTKILKLTQNHNNTQFYKNKSQSLSNYLNQTTSTKICHHQPSNTSPTSPYKPPCR